MDNKILQIYSFKFKTNFVLWFSSLCLLSLSAHIATSISVLQQQQSHGETCVLENLQMEGDDIADEDETCFVRWT